MIIYIIILIVGFRKRKPYINQLLSSIAASSMATPFLNALLRSTNQIANSIGGSRNFANSVVQAVQAQSNANAAATVVQQQVQQTGNNAGVALANNLVNLTGQSLGRVQGAAINNNPGLVMPTGGGVDVGTQLSGVDMGVGVGGNVGVMLDVLRAADRVNGVVARQQPSGDLQQIAGSVVNVINSLQGMSGVDSQVAAVEGDGLAPVAAGLGVDVGTQVQGLVESGVQTVPIGPPLGQLVGNRWRGLLDKIRGIGIGKPVDVVNYLQGMLPQKQFTDDELKKVDMLVKKLQNVSDGIRKGLIDISKSNGDPDVQTLARLVDRSVPFNEGTNGEYIDPTKSRLTPKGVALLYKYASKGLKGPGQVS